MAASSTVRVSILGDATSLTKAFREGEKGAQGFGDKLGGVGKAMTIGVTAPIVAGAALAVKAGAEEEAQMESLANVIEKRIPGATDAMVDSNEDWIANLQSSVGVADSEIRDMEQSFLAAGASVEESQRLTALAFDVSAQTGKDAATVAKGFVKGMQGSVGGLSKLGVATKDAAGEVRSFDEITAELADTMGGTAAANMDNAAGRTQRMQLQMADLTEEIGMMLLPILDKLTSMLSKVMGWFQDLSPEAKKVILVIGGVAAAIGPVLLIGAKVITLFGQISKAFKALQLVMAANPWLLLIAAVIALVIIIVANWDKITGFLKKTWKWITDTSEAVWEGIKKALKAALDFIVDLFLNWTLLGLLIKNWDKIRDGITALKDWIFDTWDSIVDFFRGLPSRIGSAVSGMWDGIKSAFRSAVNWIISKWNNLEISIGGGTILGVSIPKITVRTPNIPSFQSGGTFRAPPGQGSGLALLHDRERVLPAGRGSQGGTTNLTIPIYAGLGSDPNAIAKAVLEALQRYQRVNGPLPLDVRLN